MVTEPQRSQYLEAMGLTAWVSRYRLPNAAVTPECEWLEPEVAPERPPAQRLHALLDTEQRPPAAPTAEPVSPAPSRQQRRARGLLESEGLVEAPREAPPAETTDETSAGADNKPREPLRFTLQIAALDGRWLIVLPSEQAPDAMSRRLLDNLLQAAGIVPGAAPVFQAFNWPLVEGLPVESPLDEASEGLRAFVDGQHRRGWRPERVLVFGESAALAPVLALSEGRCSLLEIAGWQGPSLDELAQSAAAKRELWHVLAEWRQAWHRAADGDGGNAAP